MRILLFSAILAFTSAAQAGTVFTIQAKFPISGDRSLTGTIDIDTTTGWINSLDLVLKPVPWGSLPRVTFDGQIIPIDPWPNDEAHFIRGPWLPRSPLGSGVTDIGAFVRTVDGFDQHTSGANWAELALRLPVDSLVGYAGGPISHLKDNMGVGDPNFVRWSGIMFQRNGDRETFPRWPMRGEIVPLIVPEPSSFVLAALGLIGLAAWGWRLLGDRMGRISRPRWAWAQDSVNWEIFSRKSRKLLTSLRTWLSSTFDVAIVLIKCLAQPSTKC